MLRQATQLLREAGFTLRDNKLLDAAGRPMTVEFPDFDNRWSATPSLSSPTCAASASRPTSAGGFGPVPVAAEGL